MEEFPRIIATAHDGTPLGDVDPSQAVEVVAVSEINGENCLRLTTAQEFTKGDRLLWRDGMGAWREYVVEGIESPHGVEGLVHTYYCPWSVQYDLIRTFVSSMPGTGGTPATAAQALTEALAGTDRWAVGTVDVTTTGGASFWRTNGWAALKTLVETWGGEVEATITVSLGGVVARAVNLLQHVGETEAMRRFDYGADISEIRRTVLDDPWTARVLPLGAAEETDGGGYGRKITIKDVNGGVSWLQDDDAVSLTRVPDGNGGWEVPIQIVENETITDPAALKSWAQEHLTEWTRPRVSYEADVVQLVGAGFDAQGVAAGDACAVVDKDFGTAPIRIITRLLRMEENLLDRAASVLTFSNLPDGLGSQLAQIERSVTTAQNQITNMSLNQATADYIGALLQRLNAEANATGGYTYITEGQGLRTYDVAVTDPLVGAEASQVVEIKGGSVRIADSKDSAGNWEWQTVATGAGIVADSITSGTIDASLVTIANLLRIGYAAGANIAISDGKLVFNMPWENGDNSGTLNATIYPSYRAVSTTSSAMYRPVLNFVHGDTTLFLADNGIVNVDDRLVTDHITAFQSAHAGGTMTVGSFSALGNTSYITETDGTISVKRPSEPAVSVAVATGASNLRREIALKVDADGDTRGIYDVQKSKWIVYADANNRSIINTLYAYASGTSATANNYWTLINNNTGVGVRFVLNPNSRNLVVMYTLDGGTNWSATRTLAAWA